MEHKYYLCKSCGSLLIQLKGGCEPLACCGKPMELLEPGTTDGAQEKHVPVYHQEGNIVRVTVGEVNHPMQPEHFIEWIALDTKQGGQFKALAPGDPPEACFAVCGGDKVEAVYAHCNLHSFWKA